MDGVAVADPLLHGAERLFADHVDRECLADADAGGWPQALWERVEGAGFPLGLVPEAAGGVGFTFAEVLPVLRRAAFHALPLPLGETMLANALWAEASGAAIAGVLTLAPATPTDALTIRAAGAGFALAGQAQGVPWGARAGGVLLFARDEAGRGWLALADRGQAATAGARRNLANEPRDRLDFDGVAIPCGRAFPAPARLAADGLLPLGAALRVQQMVGAMERALDHALRHADERMQFGRPIGRFQAVQHMLAVAAGHLAAATAAADAIAESFGGEADRFGFDVAVAKARVGEAAGAVAAAAHQVIAAMGFTQEHTLHHVTRRLWAWREEFGAEAFWQRRLGETACRGGGAALWPMLSQS